MIPWIRIHSSDNVAVALTNLPAGKTVRMAGHTFVLPGPVPAGHKFALLSLNAGDDIIKYGAPIGHATQRIAPGEWVHTHNVQTNLSGLLEYQYRPQTPPPCAPLSGSFAGYARADGRVGVRNELWIVNTVGCVNKTAERLAALAGARAAAPVDGVYAFPHPYGCSQLGEDQENTQKLLARMVRHPNAGGVLVLGLGCENNHIGAFRKVLGDVDPARVKFLSAQDVDDEIEAGMALIGELFQAMQADRRTQQPLSRLTLGLKCGGSDGFSGITANPLLGSLADGVCAAGGTALLTEVPEMFGAETLLMNRCRSEAVFQATVSMINRYKEYFMRHGQPIYENPSPGNREGGITTLEDKSLGCVQKGGTGAVTDVLEYAQPARTPGLNLLYGPGNDACAVTGLMAAGAQIILFTTGRGTPLGAPVPTLKIATNSDLAARKPHWMDFDAGRLLSGLSMQQATQELLRLVLDTANGRPAQNERAGYREIAIFKDGVTL